MTPSESSLGISQNLRNTVLTVFEFSKLTIRSHKSDDASECFVQAFLMNPLLHEALSRFLKICCDLEGFNLEGVLSSLTQTNFRHDKTSSSHPATKDALSTCISQTLLNKAANAQDQCSRSRRSQNHKKQLKPKNFLSIKNPSSKISNRGSHKHGLQNNLGSGSNIKMGQRAEGFLQEKSPGKRGKPQVSRGANTSTKEITKFAGPSFGKMEGASPPRSRKKSKNRNIGRDNNNHINRKTGSNSRPKQVLKTLNNSQNLRKSRNKLCGLKEKRALAGLLKKSIHSEANIESSPMVQASRQTLRQKMCALYLPHFLRLLERHKEALTAFEPLQERHSNDPWVLTGIAKCYTELSQHDKARLYFSRAFDPTQNDFEYFEDDLGSKLVAFDRPFLSKSAAFRVYSSLRDIEYYSSCLWHLKKPQELSMLAFNCMEKHFFRAETWIVLGNCYSLNQDHETALKFLERALKLDPFSAYAYCLSGHEHVCKENFDKAKQSYQNAVNIDPRNLRALWGLGNLNLKMEQYDTAINYFLKAIKINNQCSTFYTQIGVAWLNKGNLEMALSYMVKGEKINPDDPFNRFNKANVRDLLYIAITTWLVWFIFLKGMWLIRIKRIQQQGEERIFI